MNDDAEKIARDSGLPKLLKGHPGYGVVEAAGRNKAIQDVADRKAKANELKIKSIRPVVIDNSIHMHMERNEPKGGYKAGGIWHEDFQ